MSVRRPVRYRHASSAKDPSWAKRNGVDTRDLKTRKGSDGRVAADVRESEYDESSNDVFGGYDRKGGFR